MLSFNDLTSPVAVLAYFSTTITLLLALLFDAVFGEAKKYHYLVGFGHVAQWLESRLNASLGINSSGTIENQNSSKNLKLSPNQQKPLKFSRKKALVGGLAWLIMVVPLPTFYWLFLSDLLWYWQILLDAFVLYLAIGLHSLHQHAMQVYNPLKANNLTQARHFTGYLVSRETHQLSPQAMSRATVESMLENGHDSVIASLFYYVIGGAPLVILHRFANTLDAMWGYKNDRFFSFGYVSARLDDVLGFISGKVCTVLYALQGVTFGRIKRASVTKNSVTRNSVTRNSFINNCAIKSMVNAYQQGNVYKSHNGGWVMAAGATVMNITLGGSANYHGKTITSVTLGSGEEVSVSDIPRSVHLVKYAALLLLLNVGLIQLACYFFQFVI